MNILSIYDHYTIPPNLRRHQFEVTAVGRFVCEHWIGEKVDKELVTQALLLHDMGNIIKFKRPFLGELEKDAKYWEGVQEQFIKKYGTDVHTATQAIVSELGLQPVGRLIDGMKDLWASDEMNASAEIRIAEYSDCCVTPEGIVGFEKRIEDLKERYHDNKTTSAIQRMLHNEAVISQQTSIDLDNLDTIDFSEEIEKLKQYVL